MRYLMMVKADDEYEAGKPPSPEMMAAVGAHAEKMAKAGVLLDMGGLLPSAAGAKVVIDRGKTRVVDGPFRGLTAVVEQRLPARDRIRVLMHVLQRQAAVELPERWVRPL